MSVKSTQLLAEARSPPLRLVRYGESFHLLSLPFLIGKVDNWLTWHLRTGMKMHGDSTVASSFSLISTGHICLSLRQGQQHGTTMTS